MPLRRRRFRDVAILLNGDLAGAGALRAVCRTGTPLLCADGGARHAARLGIEPTVVLGDMDSLPRRLPRWRRALFVCDFDPDRSDLEKCLRFAEARGARAVWVAGALGGRLDHELVNLALLEAAAQRLRVILLGRGTAESMERGARAFPARAGETVTLLPASPEARVTTEGLLYPLRGERLLRSSRGLSNRAASRRVRVRVHEGRLWVVRGLS